MPGIVSGGLIVFAWTLSAFPTPELLGGGKVKMIANVVRGPRAGLVQLAGGGGLRPARHSPCTLGAARRHGPRGRAAGVVMLRAAVVLLVAFMTLPTVVVIAVSFNPTAILVLPARRLLAALVRNVLTYPQFQRAALNSLVVTGGAVALALPIGTLAALALERGRPAAAGACGRRSCCRPSSCPAWPPASASSSWPPPSVSCAAAPSS